VIAGTKRYGKGDTAVTALDDVTMHIPAGRFTAVMGPSGSGKSTLMHCLAGLDTLTSGQVFLGEVELGALDDRRLTKLRREQVGFVFQSFNLIPTLTARENIVLPMTLAGRKPDASWVDSVIATVGLGDRLRHRPSELSGGSTATGRDRESARRAAAGDLRRRTDRQPRQPDGTEVLEFLQRAVREFGQTIVMVTHDPNAAAFVDTVVFLADGRVVDSMEQPTGPAVLDRMKRFGVAS
jgi:putative ABC transport system ATP-binding protein